MFGFKVETDSTFQCAPYKHLAMKEFYPVWDCCNQYRQPVFLHLFTDQDVEDLKILISEFPQILYVICHMGADSCFASGRKFENYETILNLVKKHSNVYLDTSTVPVYFDEERVLRRKRQILAPGEMEEIHLTKEQLKKYSDLKTITVKIEEA